MRKQIKKIMIRDLMPYPNKQDNLEYTMEDVILIAETFAKEREQQLILSSVVKSLPSEDVEFIYSLLPKWTKEAPIGLNPTLYGTLTQEGDQKVIDRLNKILK